MYEADTDAPQSNDDAVPTGSVRGSLLSAAMKMTLGDRNKQYGDPTTNHDNIARMWNAYLTTRSPLAMQLDAEDVAMMMMLMKAVRAGQRRAGMQEDTFIDMCAYGAISGEIRHNRIHGEKADGMRSSLTGVRER